jgi:hypothetical protein
MNDGQPDWLLFQATNEFKPLSRWADTCEGVADQLCDQMPVEAGWNCLELGCRPRGVLVPLSRRVGWWWRR